MTQYARKAVTLSLFIVLGVVAAAGYAQTVRGQLVRSGPYGNYPVAYIPVTVFSQRMGRSSPSYTDPNGMYYLSKVPPGDYTLEIWISPRRPPYTYDIHVNPRPFTDIRPILLP
jgi:hypothetical protein